MSTIIIQKTPLLDFPFSGRYCPLSIRSLQRSREFAQVSRSRVPMAWHRVPSHSYRRSCHWLTRYMRRWQSSHSLLYADRWGGDVFPTCASSLHCTRDSDHRGRVSRWPHPRRTDSRDRQSIHHDHTYLSRSWWDSVFLELLPWEGEAGRGYTKKIPYFLLLYLSILIHIPLLIQ